MGEDYHIALKYRRALGLRLLALQHVVNWCIQCCIILCLPGAPHGKLTTQTLKFIIRPTQTSKSQVLSDLPTWALKYHGCETHNNRHCSVRNLCSAMVLHLDTGNAEHMGYRTLCCTSHQWVLHRAQLSQYCTALRIMGKEKSDPAGFCTRRPAHIKNEQPQKRNLMHLMDLNFRPQSWREKSDATLLSSSCRDSLL